MTAHDVRILRGAALGVGALSPLVLLVAGLAAGLAGVLAAAAGLVAVTVFFLAGIGCVAAAEKAAPDLMLPVALTAFVVTLAALGALMAVVPENAHFSRTTFAVSVGVGALVWVHMQAYRVWSAKLLYVTLPKQG
ncbi:MAG: hypothetical protein M3Z02_01275 [Actinomycetota bacterium]|nr:hypothetical protein [Actinomycetota bacterium]